MSKSPFAPEAAMGVREKIEGDSIAALQASLSDLHEGKSIPMRNLRTAYARFVRVAQSAAKEFVAELEKIIQVHVTSIPNNDHLWASTGSEQLARCLGNLHQTFLDSFDQYGPVHGHYLPGITEGQDEVNDVSQAYTKVSSDLRRSVQSALGLAVANAQEMDRRNKSAQPHNQSPFGDESSALSKFLVFVSYSCKDSQHPFLERLRKHFEQPQIKEHIACFMAEDIPDFGADFIQKVIKALKAARVVVPFLTESSQLSPWVNQEIGFAHARGIPILPAFDRPRVDKLHGMIQTLDGCPIDDNSKVESLLERISTLARMWKPPKGRPEFHVDWKGIWWSMNGNVFPMYLKIEVSHASDQPDAIKSATVELEGRRFDTLDREKLGALNQVDFKDFTLKFFPTPNSGVARAKLILQTVRGKSAEVEFDASMSGWRPSELWDNFKPY